MPSVFSTWEHLPWQIWIPYNAGSINEDRRQTKTFPHPPHTACPRNDQNRHARLSPKVDTQPSGHWVGAHPMAPVGPAPLDFKTQMTERRTVGDGSPFAYHDPHSIEWGQAPGQSAEKHGWTTVDLFSWPRTHGSAGTLKNDDLIKRTFKKNQQKHYITAHKPQFGKVCSQLPYFFLFWQNQVCQAAPKGLALSGQLISSFCNRSPTKQGITVVPI